MNIDEFAEWIKDESIRTYGAHSAYARCHAEFKEMREADIIETKTILESAPEPSDTERFMWEIATKNYVERLECIVDSLIANQPLERTPKAAPLS